MSRKALPVFVQRRIYRRRRMADAVRMLPVLGAILIAIPMFWQDAAQETRTTVVMVYVFLVWVGLAGLAAVLARSLGPEKTDDTDPSEAEKTDGAG